MKYEDTFVIIPVYNEASVIGPVLKSTLAKFPNVVCVDDGSSDKSAEAVLKTKAHLVGHSINLGAGAATQTGIEFALQNPAVKYFITIDADGQHDINDVPKMLDYLKSHKLDIVFGSRFLGKVENISVIKSRFLKLAAAFSGATSGLKLTDPHIGLRVFNRFVAENIQLTMPGFAHASELLHRIVEKDFKYAELPVTVRYTDYSKAKGQSMLNAINIAFDVLLHKATKKR